jgi:hypothetical protein
MKPLGLSRGALNAGTADQVLFRVRNGHVYSYKIQARLPDYAAHSGEDFGRVGLVLIQRQ